MEEQHESSEKSDKTEEIVAVVTAAIGLVLILFCLFTAAFLNYPISHSQPKWPSVDRSHEQRYRVLDEGL